MTISYPFLFCVTLIPISVLIAKLNHKYIKKNLVGWFWHNIQFYLLFAIGYGVSYWFYEHHLAAACNTLCLAFTHWIVFDYSLNVMRGLDEMYVGYTSTIDKTWRRLTKNMREANKRTLFFAIKLYCLFASLVLFHLLWQF